jgi:hypothetical protein
MAGVGSATADAMKRAIFALMRASHPTIAYHGHYSAKVVVQSPDRRTVDLQPDDTRLPPMAKVPIKLGIPGATVVVAAGDSMLIGWENGDPQRAYASLFPTGDKLQTLSITADKIELAAEGLVFPQEGAINGLAVDSFTGMPLWMLGHASSKVGVKK